MTEMRFQLSDMLIREVELSLTVPTFGPRISDDGPSEPEHLAILIGRINLAKSSVEQFKYHLPKTV